jgi:hypothetical protein
MGPLGMQTQPLANVVATDVTTAVTGAVAAGLAAAAVGATGMTGALVVGAAALGGGAIAEAMRRHRRSEPDVIVRHPDGALYITVKFNPQEESGFKDAVAQAQRCATERSHVLYLGIRRTDLPGHPYVAQWERKTFADEFARSWMPGAFQEPPVGSRFEPPPFIAIASTPPTGAGR